MTTYCAQSDMQPFLPSGGLPNPARVATSAIASLGNSLECEGHGLALNATVTLRVAAGGSLPSPIVAGVTYYAIPIDEAHFQLAAVANGAAITLTVDGTNFVFLSPLPFAQWMDWGSRQVDSFLPEHVIPLSAPYPSIVVTAAAELAAYRGLQATGGSDIDLGARLDAVGARIARWAKTVPIRGLTAQQHQPAQLAVVSTPVVEPRQWESQGNLTGVDNTRIP